MHTTTAKLRSAFLLPLLTLFLTLGLTSPAGAMPFEEYTPYQGQVSCDPHAKAGTVAFSRLIMGKFGGRSLGIVRACSVGSTSEHKEGRAFDWGLNAHKAADRKKANRAIKWLTEEVNGVEALRAKKLGVMYMIWNKKMWRGYDPEAGWQPYTGASPHTDHVHISLTWSGATKRTSFWTKNPIMDYGPCQKWVNELAPRWKAPRLDPCPPPLHRPQADEEGFYRAQYGETVNRVARWFSKTPEQIRRWNGWPEAGAVEIYEGTRIRVAWPKAAR